MSYWAERAAKTQERLTSKSIKETQEQLKKYYAKSMKRVIKDFEDVYNKIQAQVEDKKDITPALLYRLDSYWEMQGSLKNELQKLGDEQAALLSKKFMEQFSDVYSSLALKGDAAFNTISKEAAEQMINQVWCADGKSWSSRIWNNTDKLQQALNDNLIECVVTGKKTTELKKQLQEQFNVGYNRADSLVRTEMAHIQTQAAQKRYQDYGIEMVEVWVDEDERTCPICAKHEGEKYPVNSRMPVPFHPRCRCCMIPVIGEEMIMEESVMENKELEKSKKHGSELSWEERTNKVMEVYGVKVNQEVKAIMDKKKKTYEKLMAKASRVEDTEAYMAAYVRYHNNYLLKEEEIREEVKKELISQYIFCIDCGKPLPTQGQSQNARKRCDDCQEEYRRKKKAEYERQRRARNKTK